EELRDMVDGRERYVGAAAGPLRRPDEALRGQQPQRLTHGRAADAELAREHGLVRKPLAARELAADDQVPQLVGDLLVRLADAADRNGVRRPLDRPHPGRRSHACSIPNSALPAIDTGALSGPALRSRKYSVSDRPSPSTRSTVRR